jgi:hypothetical protein
MDVVEFRSPLRLPWPDLQCRADEERVAERSAVLVEPLYADL